jgi:hypothetical protein
MEADVFDETDEQEIFIKKLNRREFKASYIII